MDASDIKKVKKHSRYKNTCITKLYGCFVNENREIISKFSLPVGSMDESEGEQFFSNIVKIFSGDLGKNKIILPFTADQVMNDAQHKLLMKLRENQLEDETDLDTLYQSIIESVNFDCNYLIMIACDTLDFSRKSAKSDEIEPDDDRTFTYLVCSICPVKASQKAIEYKAKEKEFRGSEIAQLMKVPEIGFMFPCLDRREANIYEVMLYTRKASTTLEDFAKAVFNIERVEAPATQKENLATIVSEVLGDDCTLEAIQALQDRIEDTIQVSKENNSKDAPTVGKNDLSDALRGAGISEDQIAQFQERYDESFGEGTRLAAKTVSEKRKYRISIGESTSLSCMPEDSDHLHFVTEPNGDEVIMIRLPPGTVVEYNGYRIRPSEFFQQAETEEETE